MNYTKIPGIAEDFYCLLLPLHVNQRLAHFVEIGDNLRVPLKPCWVMIMALNSLAFFTGILAYNSSLCYNITEKVFALKW